MTGAKELTARLGGRWYGNYGTAPCPVCQPDGRQDQTGLTLTDGSDKLLAHCKRSGCGFTSIMAATGLSRGRWVPPDPAKSAQREAERRANRARRAAQAKRFWDEAQPVDSSPAAFYLRGRGITCSLPTSLRFHRETWHAASALRLPALIARVQGADAFAIHRTYLLPDGSAKANISPVKAMLGSTSGGAVRLSGGSSRLVVTEGIETGLSLLCGLLNDPADVWATLSTSGMKALKLPDRPGRLMIATDGDAPGKLACNSLAARATALGWDVSVLPAPDGKDWNDVLTEKWSTT